MSKVHLTDRTVAAAKAGDLFDARAPGLNLRVAPSGLRTWFLVFTSPKDGKRARLKLGRYPETGLARARALATEARSKLEEGYDPREATIAAAMTVADLCELYIRQHCPTIKTGNELRRRLRSDVIPAVGSVKLAELHRRDLNRVIDPKMGRGKKAAAGKAFGDLRAMLRWAVARGDLDSNPLQGATNKTKSKPRERCLDEDEIATLWKAWPVAFSTPMALALRLALVTGQRIGEVCGITLEEIDLPKAVWNLPANRAKNGFAHSIPLSGLALELITEARGIRREGRLFHFNTQRVANLININRHRIPVKHWTAHDLRRSACTSMARLGISPLVIGAVVNHRTLTKGGITLGTYVQYDYAKEKREALDMWADRLAAIVSGGASESYPHAG